ncbi:hypothetical protein [Actinacidiphila sp. bgisy160]|uniref:hypothetical protein n=1 Tax=Actinacidiphila sp. bgisy160 TaxID=3413796 RepID=UPI003D76138C
MTFSHVLAHSAAYGAAVGSVLPLVAAVILRPHWSKGVKQGIVVVLAVIAGFSTVAASGAFTDATSLAELVAQGGLTGFAVIAACEAAYSALWHRFGIAQALEVATSPAPKAVDCGGQCATRAAGGLCLEPCGQEVARE